jgi:hypothetical protein
VGGPYVPPAAEDFGRERLADHELDELWLLVFSAIQTASTRVEPLADLIPRFEKAFEDIKMMRSVISILEGFMALDLHDSPVHPLCLQFGRRMSVFLREQIQATGNCVLLGILSDLWTTLLHSEDECVVFLRDPYVEETARVYDEFFVAMDLLLSYLDDFHDPEEWSELIKQAVHMAQCFLDLSHPLEFFVVRVLRFIIEVLNRGIEMRPEYLPLPLLFESNPTLVAQCLNEMVANPTPGAFLVVGAMAGTGNSSFQPEFPRELVEAYVECMGGFMACQPLKNVMNFIGRVCRYVPERLAEFLEIVMNGFQAAPECSAQVLLILVRQQWKTEEISRFARIIVPNLLAALSDLSPDACRDSALSIAHIARYLDEAEYERTVGAISAVIVNQLMCAAAQGNAALTIERINMLDGVAHALLSGDCRPCVRVLLSAFYEGLFRIDGLWNYTDEFRAVQGRLASALCLPLKHKLLGYEKRRGIAEWVSSSIGLFPYPFVLLGVLPFLNDFLPLQSVWDFLDNFDPAHQVDGLELFGSALGHCISELLKLYGSLAWTYIPFSIVPRFLKLKAGRFVWNAVTDCAEHLDRELRMEIGSVVFQHPGNSIVCGEMCRFLKEMGRVAPGELRELVCAYIQGQLGSDLVEVVLNEDDVSIVRMYKRAMGEE